MNALATTTPRASLRVGPLQGLAHSLTLAWRSLAKIRHSPEQLLDLTLQPVIFILLFVFLFGGAISHNWHTYLQFVLPGILVQTVAFATMRTGIGLNEDITKGIFDRFRSLPIARPAPLAGSIFADIVRYAFSAVIVIGFGMLLGFRIETNLVAALAACLLVMVFALALCWVSALVGLLARSPQSVQGFGFIVLFPLIFGSNILVATTTLPGWLQAWVRINPITQLATATRGLLLGGPVLAATLHTLAWTAVLLVVFFPLAMWAYRRKT